MKVIGTVTRKKLNEKSSNFFDNLKKCDGIIINGEGSLHHSNPFIDDMIKLLPRKMPTVLINSLWEHNNNKGVLEFLQNLKLISLRESFSLKDLTTHYKGLKNVQVNPDILFYENKFSPDEPGYGDSVIVEMREKLKKTINYFPMQYTNNFPTIEAYMSWLKSLKIHVTGRFHGVCLSAMAGIPFLAFQSNSHKIASILTDMGCPELLITSLDEVKNKHELALRLAPKAHKYALEAKVKLDHLFETIGGIK